MVQSWENFMDPSGGYRRNDYVDGTASMAVPLITEAVLLPFVLPRAEMLELGAARRSASDSIRRRIKHKAGGIKSAAFLYEKRDGKLLTHREAVAERTKVYGSKPAQTYRKAKADITRKYAGLKSSARAIGWGYLALMGVEMGAALLSPTPGVVKSAMENDARAMGYNTLSDSSQAYTQRQRALMAIHDSQLGIRNVIGAEAPHLHR